jgi:hypothetical protein
MQVHVATMVCMLQSIWWRRFIVHVHATVSPTAISSPCGRSTLFPPVAR